MSDVYIGIGSNLGDRAAYIIDAAEAIDELPETTLVCRSNIYETQPIGPSGQGNYYNAVIQIKTSLNADQLFSHFERLETAAGRVRKKRWFSRTLDLDILLFDDLELKTDLVTIPHPQMHQRRFVLQPLCDINSQIIHPVFNQTVGKLLEKVSDGWAKKINVTGWIPMTH